MYELLRNGDPTLFHHLTQELALHAGEEITWPLVSTFLSRCLPLAIRPVSRALLLSLGRRAIRQAVLFIWPLEQPRILGCWVGGETRITEFADRLLDKMAQ